MVSSQRLSTKPGDYFYEINLKRDFTERRLFLRAKKACFQIFSFTQNRADASIYVSFPDFEKAKWLNVSKRDGIPQLVVADSPGDGKLSVHGSGMTKIRAHDSPNEHKHIIHGNFLLDSDKQ